MSRGQFVKDGSSKRDHYLDVFGIERDLILQRQSHQRRDCVKSPKSHPRQWVDVFRSSLHGEDRVLSVINLFLANARKRNEENNNG